FGFMGVPIFFAISGFCIHLSFYRQGQKWGSFFLRRFFRLYPAYMAAVLLFALLFTHSAGEFWRQFSSHALFSFIYNQATYHGLNGSFWSVAVEVQLYLIYPLLLALVARFGWKRTLICLAGCEIFLEIWDGVFLWCLHILWRCCLHFSFYFPPC
ncbi:MAG: acyltransferase family protein, partial [Limisphaerales bacterium]